MKISGKIITLIAILIVLGFLAVLGTPDGKIARSLTIKKTENLVTGIKKISELTTTCYRDELVLTEERTEKKESILQTLKIDPRPHYETRRIAIIAHGTVRAGFNLSKINQEDIKVSMDTVSLRLPAPEILDITINPSGFETFDSVGEWNEDEEKRIKSRAKSRIMNDAVSAGLLEKAGKSGREKIRSFLKTLGYVTVFVDN